MKLNYDCIRDILLFLEVSEYNTSIPVKNLIVALPKYQKIDIEYSCLKLHEANMINAHVIDLDNMVLPMVYQIRDITISGHEFLANIHSDNIWNKVKDTASNIGVGSLSAFVQIASSVVAASITNYLKFP